MFSRCLCLQSSNRSQASLEVRAAQTLNSPMEIFIFSFEDVTWYVLGLDAQTRCDMVCFGGGRATDYLDPVSHIPKLTKETCFLLLTTILVPAVCLAGGNDISQTARYFQSNKLVCTLSVN